jgi:hypothetical protein
MLESQLVGMLVTRSVYKLVDWMDNSTVEKTVLLTAAYLVSMLGDLMAAKTANQLVEKRVEKLVDLMALHLVVALAGLRDLQLVDALVVPLDGKKEVQLV